MKQPQLEKAFERARRSTSSRQEFLDSIKLGFARIYVKRIFYEPEQKYRPLETNESYVSVMECVTPSKHIGENTYVLPFSRSVIRVYPIAFDEQLNPTVQHFLSDLIDHECFHAKEIFWRPKVLGNEEKLEERAYWNQVEKSEGRGLDSDYRQRICNKFLGRKELLSNVLG